MDKIKTQLLTSKVKMYTIVILQAILGLAAGNYFVRPTLVTTTVTTMTVATAMGTPLYAQASDVLAGGSLQCQKDFETCLRVGARSCLSYLNNDLVCEKDRDKCFAAVSIVANSSPTIATNTTTGTGSATDTGTATGTSTGSATGTATGTGTGTALVAPSALTYTGSPYTYTTGTAITTNTPTVTGTVTSCTANPTLPTGLSLAATTCAISGTPTESSSATTYTITAANTAGSTTATISITVNPPAPTALTYSGSPYTYTNGTAITTNTPIVTGTVTSCTANPTLPTGLSINATTCAISGTPTANSTATNYTITAANASGSTTATINITVNAAGCSPGKRSFWYTDSGGTNGISTLGNLGGIAGADALCNNATNKPTAGTYKAFLTGATRRACSTANCSGGVGENLDWVLQPNTAYFISLQTTLATISINTCLVSFTTNAAGIFTSMPNQYNPNSVRFSTGLNTDWTNSANNCTDWTSASNASFRAIGEINAFNAANFYSSSTSTFRCDNGNLVLLCIEQ